jgi:hypothetical protein
MTFSGNPRVQQWVESIPTHLRALKSIEIEDTEARKNEMYRVPLLATAPEPGTKGRISCQVCRRIRAESIMARGR